MALTQLGIIRYLRQEDSEAMVSLSKAIACKNSFVPAIVAIGELLRLKGLVRRGLVYLEKAVSLDKMQVTAFKGLVNACYEVGDT